MAACLQACYKHENIHTNCACSALKTVSTNVFGVMVILARSEDFSDLCYVILKIV